MDKQLALEILQCLPVGRTLYAYGKDAYALQLLKYYSGSGKSIAAIKRSRYARLLGKTPVRRLLAARGNNRLSAADIDNFWIAPDDDFALSLDLWNASRGDWAQASRRGWNLVLQLNFSNRHNQRYRELVKPVQHQLLNCCEHPVFRRNKAPYFRETLAWARLDIDFEHDECLIEEIQSDWVRDAKFLLVDARRAKKYKRQQLSYWPVRGRLDDIIEYCEELSRTYNKYWSEAMLSAALHFIKTELGLSRVYYHSSESGAQIKNILYSKPPKSLYSTLPRAFCFNQTLQEPGLLRDDTRYKRLKRKLKTLHWYELNLG